MRNCMIVTQPRGIAWMETFLSEYFCHYTGEWDDMENKSQYLLEEKVKKLYKGLHILRNWYIA